MVSEDTYISSDGSVIGTLKFVKEFKEFNLANESEQKGNYFPITLSNSGNKMTLKKNGLASEEKTDMTFDKDIILRVASKSDVYSIDVDGQEVISLKFTNATLETE